MQIGDEYISTKYYNSNIELYEIYTVIEIEKHYSNYIITIKHKTSTFTRRIYESHLVVHFEKNTLYNSLQLLIKLLNENKHNL